MKCLREVLNLIMLRFRQTVPQNKQKTTKYKSADNRGQNKLSLKSNANYKRSVSSAEMA
jgi:hypothetical protein